MQDDVRPLTPADAAAFAALRLLGLERHPEAFGSSADAWRGASPEQVAALFASDAGAAERFVLGAFADGQLVGVLGFRREARPAVRHKGSLWGLFVHPDHRRGGRGTALLTKALALAATYEGLRYVRAVVTVASVAALHLLEQGGFVRYGREPGGLLVGDTAHDQVFLLRSLDAP